MSKKETSLSDVVHSVAEAVGLAEPVAVPKTASFDTAILFVLGNEGGFSNVAADGGGPTMFGITQDEYSRFLGRLASVADVQRMSLRMTDETVLQTGLTMKEEKLIKLETNKKLLPAEGSDVTLVIVAK